MNRKILLLAFFIFAMNGFSYSQIIAGSGAPGMIISDPTINMTSLTFGSYGTRYIDLDCDSIADIRIEMYKFAPIVDIPNQIYLIVMNPYFEINGDTGITGLPKVIFLNIADSINYPGVGNWRSDTVYEISFHGGFDCYGPPIITDKFIGFRNNLTSQLGWIKISFDISDMASPITLTVPEILSPCDTTSLPYLPLGNDSCSLFSYSYSSTPEYCNSDCNGSITINITSGGSPPFMYSIDGGSSFSSSDDYFVGLCAGTYNAIIKDANENYCSFNVAIYTPTPLTISISSITPVSCYGFGDGEICLSSAGGSAPYQYSVYGGPLSGSYCLDVPAGTNNVCVTDMNGCQTCTTLVITEPPPMPITVNSTNSCNGTCDGSACFSTSGGISPYFYFTSFGTVSAIGCISGLCIGTYSVIAIDSVGCTTSMNFSITQPSPFSLSFSQTPPSCETCCDGDLQLFPIGGTPPYTISYTLDSASTPGSFCGGNYIFCVTDSCGSQVCDSTIIAFSYSAGSSISGSTGVSTSTGIYHLQNESNLIISPNPFTDYFSIQTNHQKLKSITVFSADGKIIFSNSYYDQAQIKIVTSTWTPGIYFVKTLIGDSFVMNKLVKE